MSSDVLTIVSGLSETFIFLVPALLLLGIAFSALSSRWACNPGKPRWRNDGLWTDAAYWLVIPLMARYLRVGLLIVAVALLFGIHSEDGLILFFQHGRGPLAHLPFWAQTIVFLIVSDAMLYWIHRVFHGPLLWKFHAVHHSSEDLDWISAARFHPVNLLFGAVAVDVTLILAGISPNVFILLGPLMIAHSAFAHANLNWTLGPLKYVIVGPVFHRSHHELTERGEPKNFATLFPLFDLLFGTFAMPAGVRPRTYGVPERDIPESFRGQLIYPFMR
jgi:sterol desaturase/sphingolipid hydroxylase (fatty acid hydroxylase superfamily)